MDGEDDDDGNEDEPEVEVDADADPAAIEAKAGLKAVELLNGSLLIEFTVEYAPFVFVFAFVLIFAFVLLDPLTGKDDVDARAGEEVEIPTILANFPGGIFDCN
jgi:hypothetical protein